MEGLEEECTGWERTRGAESFEEEEEEEEEESEGSVPGVETVRVEKVTFDHKLNICLASCFCSTCRACDSTTSVLFAPSTLLLSLSLRRP